MTALSRADSTDHRRHPWLTLALWRSDFLASVRIFWAENGLGMAGTIAFFGFLSLIPLVILLLAVMGDALLGHVSSQQVQQLVHNVLPGLTDRQFIHAYWDPVKHSHRATTVLGALSLVLGTLGLHDSVDWSVSRMWDRPKPRSFWLKKLRGALIVVWAAVLALLTLGLTWIWVLALNAVHASEFGALGWLTLIPSLIIDTAVFTALYRLTPTVSVRARAALIAGVLAASGWEISKLVFGWWVIQIGTYNKVYGPLAASIIVMLWLWVSAVVFLLGAALTAVLQKRWEASEADRRP